jgi:hypothetical protein
MGMALDNYEDRYAAATHTVMFLMDDSDKTYTPEDAAYRAAMTHGLGLNQYGRLVREAKERYGEVNEQLDHI